ncbi:hypothetical protein HDV03_000195 [Kappamyces sp. JEL0829]|nr:hypothetical protein HDV03_000195 [Kappamyces sp. JEL0829]
MPSNYSHYFKSRKKKVGKKQLRPIPESPLWDITNSSLPRAFETEAKDGFAFNFTESREPLLPQLHPGQSRPTPPAVEPPDSSHSLWDQLLVELGPDYYDDKTVQERGQEKTKRVLNFLQVPRQLEGFLSFGYLICLDSFLYLFTILPLRILLALWSLLSVSILRGKSLTASQKIDLMMGLLLAASSLVLQNVDASQLYHTIRGQAIIKLYVIFNALEICDKLCSAFGHDILDSLYSTVDSHSSSASKRFSRVARFIVAAAYVSAHTLVLFYQVMSLNVAINSYNNALLTLLISNQFVEIKGSVFKKFEKGNLFQLSCADIVERFQLTVFLVIVTIRNCLEILGSGAMGDISNYVVYSTISIKDVGLAVFSALANPVATVQSLRLPMLSQLHQAVVTVVPRVFSSNEFKLGQIILGPSFIVMGTEIIVDWIKHAFIVKFNGLEPTVYTRFQESLRRDLLGTSSNRKPADTTGGARADRSPIVAKRIGFVSLPLACLAVRVAIQILQIVGVMPETLVDEPRTPGLEDEYLEDEHIGSWKLPYKLTIWIKAQRTSFQKAGFSGSSFFLASQRYSWIIPLYLCLTIFKLLIGIRLQYLSKPPSQAEKHDQPSGSLANTLDEMLVHHTPHHMLPPHLMRPQGSSPQSSQILDEIDRFSMVKSRIP